MHRYWIAAIAFIFKRMVFGWIGTFKTERGSSQIFYCIATWTINTLLLALFQGHVTA